MKKPISVLIVGATIGLATLAMACSSTTQGAAPEGTRADNPTQSAPAAAPTTAPVLAVAPTDVPVVAPTPAPAPTEPAPPPPPPANIAPPPPPAPPANTAPPPPPPPAPSASATLTLELADNSFAPSQLTVAAGTPITLTVDNGGKAMHNFDLQGVTKTALQPSGQSAVATFTVQAGTYTFICDVHPKEMIGTLIAQ